MSTPRRMANAPALFTSTPMISRIARWRMSSRLLITKACPDIICRVSIAQELTGLPEFRKYMHYTAYGEGWGLYAERLGKDVGFYQDPYSDFGRLEADIFRAIRLVVDTGVHSKHWTRDQMVEFFKAHSGLDDATVNAEVDRYIAWPAQALGYKMGQLKILELRARAQKELGSKFDFALFTMRFSTQERCRSMCSMSA